MSNNRIIKTAEKNYYKYLEASDPFVFKKKSNSTKAK